ncbi:MAG TPA: hypothetical protein ENI65_11305 [Gammaproteobacteria bacterium]|nr:hypothetical protein [Gammaproteobacteria bacterium]
MTYQSASDEITAGIFVRISAKNTTPVLEWNNHDNTCIRFLAHDQDARPVSTARLPPGGQKGCMTILAGWHNKGRGSAMLDTTPEYCMKNNTQPYLDVQSGIIEYLPA